MKDLRCPEKMDVFVREALNHSMESRGPARPCLGSLLHKLVQEQLLARDKLIAG